MTKQTESKKITSVSDLLDWIAKENLIDSNWAFRGVKSVSYELIPSIGRMKTSANAEKQRLRNEHLLEEFKRLAVAHLRVPPDNDIDWLVIAQHHRLPTPLLDWSFSPLVAMYFACEDSHHEDEQGDRLIYAWQRRLFTGKIENLKPEESKKAIKFAPKALSPRIVGQQALFSIQSDPAQPMQGTTKKAVVKESAVKDLQKKLNRLGINRASLFPDLDGIADYLKWRFERVIGFNL